MIYVNKKTGAQLDTDNIVCGENWEPLIAKEDADVELTSMTKPQLVAFAKANEIEINPSGKKNEILEEILADIEGSDLEEGDNEDLEEDTEGEDDE